jgi:hypothetical protein
MAFLKALFGSKQKPVEHTPTDASPPDPRETASLVNYMLMRDDVALYGMPRERLGQIAAKLPEPVQGAFTGGAPLYLTWRLIEYFGSIYGAGFRADATALSSTFLMRANDTIPDVEEMSKWLRRHFAAMDQAERE